MPQQTNSTRAILAPILCYAGVLGGLYLLGNAWAAIVGYHLAICVVLTVCRGWSDVSQLIRGWRGLVGVGLIVICSLSGLSIYLLWSLIKLEHIDLGESLAALGLHGFWWWSFIVYYSLVNPWLEELFWRGFYPRQLKQPLWADLLFAGYHVFVLVLFVKTVWALLCFAVLVTTAWFWRAIGRRYGGLLIPATSHLVADVSVILAALILASTTR